MQQEARPRASGPLVWRDMDQQALDRAYDQLVYAPNRDQLLARNTFNSERARARLGPPQRLVYGESEAEQLDLYPTDRPNAPVQMFIHGGGWQTRSAGNFAFLAETFVRAGAHFAALDFIGIEDTGGELMPIADQVRRGVAWVHANAASFGGDPKRLFLTGHSSGAHLAANVATTDWAEYGAPDDILKGALVVSGMYDLEPVRLSARSGYVNFSEEVEEQLSAQRRIDRLNCPLIVAYGDHETPEFQRQARDFAAAVEAAGKPVTLLLAEGSNHFEILETLANPYGLIADAVLGQMGLAASASVA